MAIRIQFSSNYQLLLKAFVGLVILTASTNANPVKKENLPSVKELKFMQKFGYLDTPDPQTEALYKEEAVIEAIKVMQKFGAVAQTGIMDNATRALMTTRRCGVPDVIKADANGTRAKRFVIASDGWTRRHLTYFLANWSPKLGPRDMVLKELARAFKVWSQYSPLTFTHQESAEADIIVQFASYSHGDGYPFDGPGMTLAHAFFPYDFVEYGGDIHFDNEEDWIAGPGDGVDFFSVASHELGHSLGLAHSADPESIMFPYYKGYDPYFRLGYDDILAMHQLYSAAQFEDAHLGTPYGYPTEDRQADDRTNHPNGDGRRDDNDDDSHGGGRRDDDPYGGGPRDDDSYGDGRKDDPQSKDGDKEGNKNPDAGEITTTLAPYTPVPPPPTTISPPPKIPDICEGSYDTATLIRGELFVFKGQYMWRYRERKHLEYGYPTQIRHMFNFPKLINRIDAAYENEKDNGNIMFFSGRNIFIFDGNRFLDKWPRTLDDLGIDAYVDKLDAAFIWGKNGKTYFFSGSEYWRLDTKTLKKEPNYPHGMKRWRGLPYPVDTAFKWRNGETYFFLGTKFYGFNDKKVRVEEHFPLPAAEYWFGCPEDNALVHKAASNRIKLHHRDHSKKNDHKHPH